MADLTYKKIDDIPKLENWSDITKNTDKFGVVNPVNENVQNNEVESNALDDRNIKELPNTVYDKYGNEIGYVKYRNIRDSKKFAQTAIDIVPIGSIFVLPVNLIPQGYLLADGSAVSRTVYKNLFGLIGTTFGTGDGSTTFNLPNLKGRVIVGFDSTQTEFDTIGETGGAKVHTLLTSEMPVHTHTQNSHTHSTWIEDNTSPNLQTGSGWQTVGRGGTNVGSTTATNQNAGGGGSHNNLQPYIALNYIIKF